MVSRHFEALLKNSQFFVALPKNEERKRFSKPQRKMSQQAQAKNGKTLPIAASFSKNAAVIRSLTPVHVLEIPQRLIDSQLLVTFVFEMNTVQNL